MPDPLGDEMDVLRTPLRQPSPRRGASATWPLRMMLFSHSAATVPRKQLFLRPLIDLFIYLFFFAAEFSEF